MGTRIAIIAGIAVLLATPAYSQDDQYQHAKAALMQGRTDEARQLYCNLASAYPNYKNARAMCTMLQAKGTQPSDYDSYYEMGVRFFNEGNYDEAAEAFQKVRGGSHRDDAKDYLLYRLPQARLKAAEAAAAPPAPAPPPPAPATANVQTPTPPRRPAAVVERKEGASLQKESSPSNRALADALTEYYAGQFDRADSDLQAYVEQHPQDSLGQFYLGVCRLTRYYIAPERSRPQELLTDAQAAFRRAKQGGFSPPGKYISPKILQVYAATTP